MDATAARKVELAVGELDSLSVTPSVAVQYLSKVLQDRFSPGSLTEIVECEPVLAAEVISLAQRLGAGPVEQRHAIRLVLDRLDVNEVRTTLLSTKVTAGFEIEFAEEHPAVPSRTDLILHSVAVACAARRIAEAAPTQVQPDLAYTAGLLHDIGKFALQDIMPRSLAAITKEAQDRGESLEAVELRHLGTTHALLGKQLAHRWHFPEPIALAIWLHHGDPAAVLESIPNARPALLVWAADAVARHAGIGHGGSYNAPEPPAALAAALGLSLETLQEIQETLPAQVEGKVKVLGLDLPHAAARYCTLIQNSAAQLAGMHAQLAAENRNLQMASGFLDFAEGFLRSTSPGAAAIYIAEEFARRWQRYFQTGSVCVYWPGQGEQNVVEAVIVEALGHSRKLVLEPPENGDPIPRPIAGKFALVDARNHVDWLLEQVEVDFDTSRTKLAPVLCDGQAIAVIAFELNYPGDVNFFSGKFEAALAMAAAVLGLGLAGQRQERLLECLAQIRTQATECKSQTARPAQAPAPSQVPAELVAEMAAGIAHELNNPLSVIAGRAQLLARAEADGQKRHVLDVIGENAREASRVIDDLMSFARPEPPRPGKIDVRRIIEDAVLLAMHKTGIEHINSQVHMANGACEVFVDSGQIVPAIANVIANSVESYADPLGPIKVIVEPTDGMLRLRISDLGYGMDAETLRKALHPFFSAKPAGRKRGMGLAYADRLVRLNGGSLSIESRPDHGTIVTIMLPCH